jgi:hypothetical protein
MCACALRLSSLRKTKTFPSNRRALAAVCSSLAALAALVAPRVAAASSLPLVPNLSCVAENPQTQTLTAYFGYTNSGPSMLSIGVGEDNTVMPGDAFEGQPDVFDAGNYSRVFAVTFDPQLVPGVSWVLNGVAVTASSASPACVSGVTAPPSAAAATSVTLNGVVIPDGVDTTYYFEYGTSLAFGQSTAVQDAGAGPVPSLVQFSLSGLLPATQYYFRIDTVGPFGLTSGQPQTFKTAQLPVLIIGGGTPFGGGVVAVGQTFDVVGEAMAL